MGTTNDYDGYTSTKNSPYGAVSLIKYGRKLQAWKHVDPPQVALDNTGYQRQTSTMTSTTTGAMEHKKSTQQFFSAVQDDKILMMVLLGMLVHMLIGLVYTSVKRQQRHRCEP